MATPRGRADGTALVDQPWWATPRGAAIIVVAAAAATFARSLGNGFSYDEGLVIVSAQRFLQSGSFATLLSPRYFAASLEGTWRPVCTFTYMLDAMVAMHPAVFKAQSLLWHAGAACLVMAVARRVLPPPGQRFAIVAGLLFALHPVTTEVVDNASFREDSLVTVFALATLVLALDGRRALALGCYALGLLSKESAVMAPALLAGIRLLGLDQRSVFGRRTVDAGDAAPTAPARLGAVARELVPYAAVTLVYLGLRFGPMSFPGTYARYPGGSLRATLIGLPAIWAHDVRVVLWPWPLCADYLGYFPFGPQPLGPVIAASVVVLAFVALVAAAAARGRRCVCFGLGWFAVTLLPVSNLIPIPIPAADRFLYLPLVGVAIAAAAAVGPIAARPGPRRAAIAVGAGALAAYAALVNVRHADWRDDATLWQATTDVNPRSCGAQSAVGGNLLSRGIASGDPDVLHASAAREELALSLCPDDDAGDTFRLASIYTRLGAARALLDDRDGARPALARAAALAPRYALPVAWLGYVAYRDGDLDQAAALLKHAIIDLGPADGTVATVAQLYVDKI